MKKVIRQLFVALCLMVAPLTVNAQELVIKTSSNLEYVIPLNEVFFMCPSDGILWIYDSRSTRPLMVDISAITGISYRGSSGGTSDGLKGDVNEDKMVDVADIAAVIDIMAGKVGAPKDVVAVDLGLPSGTKWANMNVGAEKVEGYGLFFAWGELVGYTSVAEGELKDGYYYTMTDGRLFDWASFKWINKGQRSWQQINKYQVDDGQTNGCWYDSDGNFIGDGKPTLDLADDAARANWGGDWRMPTYDDIKELVDNTTSEWTTMNGVKGRKFTAKNKAKDGNIYSIFLPAAGERSDGDLVYQTSGGYYWSSSVASSKWTCFAYVLYFDSDPGPVYTEGMFDIRCRGFNVRPVLRN